MSFVPLIEATHKRVEDLLYFIDEELAEADERECIFFQLKPEYQEKLRRAVRDFVIGIQQDASRPIVEEYE